MANETDLRNRLIPAASLPEGVIGPGDDAAVIPLRGLGGSSLVVSCDALEEGVHFRQGWLAPGELARKLVAVNVSDLAAMGAWPRALLVAIACDRAVAGRIAEAFAAGLQEACDAWGCPVVGGDTDVRDGPLRVEATIVGACDEPLLRSAARPGHRLFVSGRLGGAAAAVRAWESGGSPLAGAREAFARPVPRLDVATAVRPLRPACIDLSDSLHECVLALARASGVAMRVRRDALPLHEALGGDPLLAWSGGEDYELLLSGDATLQDAWPGLAEIGEVIEGPAGRVDLA